MLALEDERRYSGMARRIIWWNGMAGHIEVYDLESHERVLVLGPDGDAAAQRFAATGVMPDYVRGRRGPLNLVANNTVYEVDCDQRLVRRLFAPPGGAPIAWFGNAFVATRTGKDAPRAQRFMAIAGNTFWLLDKDGGVLRQWPLPSLPAVSAVSSGWTQAKVGELEQGRLGLVVSPLPNRRSACILVGADGKVERNVVVDLSAVERRVNAGVRPRDDRLAAPTLLPPLPGLMRTPVLIQAALLTLALAGGVFWHQTRIGRRGWRRIGWTTFTLLLSALGFAAYLVAFWDRRTALCPGCGKRRLVEEDACPHCRASWPAPARLGIEVLD